MKDAGENLCCLSMNPNQQPSRFTFYVSRLMYKLHLILKYLLKRRIAWVSLLAVALCTTMVLVVISVMGGWLNMFKSSFRGLSGDLVVHTCLLYTSDAADDLLCVDLG